MSTAGSIRVGKAFIELFADDEISGTLKKVGGRLKVFGAAVAKVGAGLAAAGAAGAAAFGGAALRFADTSAALNKLSLQTGESTGKLAELRAAAGLAGVDFEDLAGSIEESNIRMGEALRDGSGPLHDTLQQLGVDMQALGKLSPADRFVELSKILQGIKDPALKQFLGDELFGGDAFKVMPLLEKDIAKVIGRAKELGLVLTPEEIAGGAALKTATLPLAPEFAEMLLQTPEAKRKGRVFNPLPITNHHQKDGICSKRISDIISKIGAAAGVKVSTSQAGRVKFASAHDLRRSFGERWAARIMPKDLMVLMRHESIDTTMRFYVGENASNTADALWNAYATAGGNTSGNTALNETSGNDAKKAANPRINGGL